MCLALALPGLHWWPLALAMPGLLLTAIDGAGVRRALLIGWFGGVVHWSHPAYANRHIVVRNDREIVRASLEGR